VLDASESPSPATDLLVEVVYELLDAHEDTIRLADELRGHSQWDAHLDYLRDLHRVGREALARVPSAQLQRG
jgi:hypothetical protein